eukprot:2296298-Amphidinium_carterae.1
MFATSDVQVPQYVVHSEPRCAHMTAIVLKAQIVPFLTTIMRRLKCPLKVPCKIARVTHCISYRLSRHISGGHPSTNVSRGILL